MNKDLARRATSWEDRTQRFGSLDEVEGIAERRGEEARAHRGAFGGLLRAYRGRGSLTQERLSDRSGLSVRTIRELETGRIGRPRADSVRLLADALRLNGWERERFEETACGSQPASLARPRQEASGSSGVTPQEPPNIADFVRRADQARQLPIPASRRADGAALEFSGTAVIILTTSQLHLQVSRILQAIQPSSSANGQPRPAVGPIEALTRRELEVLGLIAKGRRNREIARDLFVALDTVKKHAGNILRKLGAASRTHAVARARELDLIPRGIGTRRDSCGSRFGLIYVDFDTLERIPELGAE
jgi:DNA-binding CsgD family transcriptional regulator/transcriptional regulator with XRE-family HTH domain